MLRLNKRCRSSYSNQIERPWPGGWLRCPGLRSSREFIAEHRQTAQRLLPRGLVLDDVPVLREHSILHAHDVSDDPRRWQAVTTEPPMEDNEITIRHRNVVLVAQRGGQGLH